MNATAICPACSGIAGIESLGHLPCKIYNGSGMIEATEKNSMQIKNISAGEISVKGTNFLPGDLKTVLVFDKKDQEILNLQKYGYIEIARGIK